MSELSQNNIEMMADIKADMKYVKSKLDDFCETVQKLVEGQGMQSKELWAIKERVIKLEEELREMKQSTKEKNKYFREHGYKILLFAGS